MSVLSAKAEPSVPCPATEPVTLSAPAVPSVAAFVENEVAAATP